MPTNDAERQASLLAIAEAALMRYYPHAGDRRKAKWGGRLRDRVLGHNSRWPGDFETRVVNGGNRRRPKGGYSWDQPINDEDARKAADAIQRAAHAINHVVRTVDALYDLVPDGDYSFFLNNFLVDARSFIWFAGSDLCQHATLIDEYGRTIGFAATAAMADIIQLPNMGRGRYPEASLDERARAVVWAWQELFNEVVAVQDITTHAGTLHNSMWEIRQVIAEAYATEPVTSWPSRLPYPEHLPLPPECPCHMCDGSFLAQLKEITDGRADD